MLPRKPLIGVALAALVPLSGCAWLNPPVSVEAGSSSGPAAVAVPSVDSSGVAILPPGISFDRVEVAKAAAETLDCPDGHVTITASGGSFSIPSYCAELTVEGDSNIVTAGRVGRLRVVGYSHVVLVESAAKVTLPPDTGDCIVQWEIGSPAIDNEGTGSLLTKART